MDGEEVSTVLSMSSERCSDAVVNSYLVAEDELPLPNEILMDGKYMSKHLVIVASNVTVIP